MTDRERENGCALDIYSYGQSMTPAAGQTENNKRKSMKDVCRIQKIRKKREQRRTEFKTKEMSVKPACE